MKKMIEQSAAIRLYKIQKMKLFSKGRGTQWLPTSEWSRGTNYPGQSQSQSLKTTKNQSQDGFVAGYIHFYHQTPIYLKTVMPPKNYFSSLFWKISVFFFKLLSKKYSKL